MTNEQLARLLNLLDHQYVVLTHIKVLLQILCVLIIFNSIVSWAWMMAKVVRPRASGE